MVLYILKLNYNLIKKFIFRDFMDIPKIKKFDERVTKPVYKSHTDIQIQQTVYKWLFDALSLRDIEEIYLDGKENNTGHKSMNILHHLGLYDTEEEPNFKGLFKENSIEEAISILEDENDVDFYRLICILKRINLDYLFDEKENDLDTDLKNKDKNDLTLNDALKLIQYELKKQDWDINFDDSYDALIVKKLPASDIILNNKPFYDIKKMEENKGKTTHIAFTSIQRNMFPYLRIPKIDDENTQDYLNNFFILNIPIFLDYSNFPYLRKYYQKWNIRGNDIEKQLEEVDKKLNDMDSNEKIIETHSSIYVNAKTDQQNQIGLSVKYNDGEEFYLLRELLFEDDFFIILKRKQEFAYEVYCLKNRDGTLLSYIDGKFFTDYKSQNNSASIDLTDFKRLNFNPNRIFFGAPGTGQSYTLNQQKDNIICGDEYYERVTFHPDYSYANFVGTYKPIMKEDNNSKKKEITYEFVPGPFLRIFVKAMKNKIEAERNGIELKIFLLIIEEINRANVSAVFGEVFQLLDRDENNESEYSINVSEDIKNHLIEKFDEELENGFDEEDYETYFPNNEIKIPNNMFIWATMNSADQGVFPIDTAFKRRWDFEYISINNNEELIENLEIESNTGNYSWNKVRKAINNYLLKNDVNEDKLMGPFFIKETPNKDFTQLFKDKVLMYLYEDAAKPIRPRLFEGSKKRSDSFSYLNICNDFSDIGIGIFHEDIVDKIEAVNGPKSEDDGAK